MYTCICTLWWLIDRRPVDQDRHLLYCEFCGVGSSLQCKNYCFARGRTSSIKVMGVLVVPQIRVKNAVVVPLRLFSFKTFFRET